MLQRIAVVDVGTNSIIYLLAQKEHHKRIEPVHQEHHDVRLGRMVWETGLIQEKPILEAISCLKQLYALAIKQHSDSIICVGTHIFRKAGNRHKVCERIFSETNLPIEILSESEEASWSFRGAVYGRAFPGTQTVIDIGGGSTELIQGTDGLISRFKSIELGAVTLTEKWITHDPPDDDEIKHLESAVTATWRNTVKGSINATGLCVGVGGSVTTLAALVLGLEVYDSKCIDGILVDLKTVQKLIDHMSGMNLAKRKKVLKSDPKRADIILAGAIILKVSMHEMHCSQIFISDQGLRFGIALREFGAVG